VQDPLLRLPRYLSGAVSTKEAAIYLGVTVSAISQYRRRGHLKPAGGTDSRPLYRISDLDVLRRPTRPKNRSVNEG
jgi:DNA-binding transcriptional MerR regulator